MLAAHGDRQPPSSWKPLFNTSWKPFFNKQGAMHCCIRDALETMKTRQLEDHRSENGKSVAIGEATRSKVRVYDNGCTSLLRCFNVSLLSQCSQFCCAE